MFYNNNNKEFNVKKGLNRNFWKINCFESKNKNNF